MDSLDSWTGVDLALNLDKGRTHSVGVSLYILLGLDLF